MADFDPFANQGGPAAWDPQHSDDSRKRTDELLKNTGEAPGAEPRVFGDGGEPDPELDLEFELDEPDSEGFDDD